MSERYPGGIITKNPVAPSGPYETSTATGIWTLEQAMQFKQQGIWPTAGNPAPPSVIGQAFGGGFYAGQIGVAGVATHYLIVGPVASAENTSIQWKNANNSTVGAASDIDGPQNTADIVADGNSTVYPAAHFCNDLSTGGQTDWYMPAKNELEVCYYNLKPSTTSNNTGSGTNTNAVPSRGSNYTAGTPAQTSAAAFQTGGAEAFSFSAFYWSSTGPAIDVRKAWRQYFNTGTQYNAFKDNNIRVRAVRRVAVF
jgi:hypothetical protein